MQWPYSVVNLQIQFVHHRVVPIHGAIVMILAHPFCDYEITAIAVFRVPENEKIINLLVNLYGEMCLIDSKTYKKHNCNCGDWNHCIN